jgi:type II secretory pathway component PulK
MLSWIWRELTRPRGAASHRFYRARSQRRSEGGVALLIVITTLMFMTVLVTDLNYGARVRLLMAAHQRDEAQAYWLARTGQNLYALILAANKEIAKNDMLSGMGDMFGVNLGDALWQMVPAINTGLLRMLFVFGDSVDEDDLEAFQEDGVSDEVREKSMEGGGRFDDKNFLDFEGDFAAQIVDEDSKVSIASLGQSVPSSGDWRDDPAAQQLYGLMSGTENDQWFYDRNLDRWNLIGNLKDWSDSDNMVSSGQGSYEDNFYNRQDPPYLTKNAPFDSKEEIRLVEGWQDDVYERFRDQITIYGNGRVNINTASDEVIKGLIRAFYPQTQNPGYDEQLDQVLLDMREYMLMTSFQKAKDFVSWLDGQGLPGEPLDGLQKAIKTSSEVFTITSVGSVGDTTVTVTAVMDFSSSSFGKTLFWRVD